MRDILTAVKVDKEIFKELGDKIWLSLIRIEELAKSSILQLLEIVQSSL